MEVPQPNDLSRSLIAPDQNSTIIAVVELSQSSWLVAGVLPGVERQPRKKLEPSPERLHAVLHRWRDEAVRAGRNITRIALAFEADRDGFWLARWPEARGVKAHVIHPSRFGFRASGDVLRGALLVCRSQYSTAQPAGAGTGRTPDGAIWNGSGGLARLDRQPRGSKFNPPERWTKLWKTRGRCC
jgi:hypothetical protein